MSWITKIFGIDKKIASAVERVMRTYVTGDETFEDEDRIASYGDYIKTYPEIVWVYACVSRLGKDIAQVPFRLFKDDKEIFDHPILSLLSNTNSFQTEYDLKEMTMICLGLTGNAYWYLIMLGNEIKEIWTKPPNFMKIVPDAQKFIKEYQYIPEPGKIYLYKPEEIIHFKFANPINAWYGQSPISAGANSIITERYAINYNKDFFKKGGRLSSYISAKGALSKESFKRMEKQIKTKYKANFHGIGLFDSDSEWKQIGLSAKDAEFIQGRKMSRDEICSIFGVPPLMIMNMEAASKLANAEVQRRLYWRDTVTPLLTKITGTLTEFLCPKYDDKLYITFDKEYIDSLLKDESEERKDDKNDVNSGIITINEARENRGLNPVKWGDTWHRPINLIEVGEPVPAKAIALLETKSDLSRWKRFNLLLQKFSKIQKPLVTHYFVEQEKQIMRSIKGNEQVIAKAVKQAKEGRKWGYITKDIDMMPEPNREMLSTVTKIKGVITTSVEESGKLAAVELGTEFDITSPNVIRWIEQNAKNLIKGINKTTLGLVISKRL